MGSWINPCTWLLTRLFLELFLSHVIMNKTKAAVERHGNGHTVFGDGIHIGGYNG